MAILLFVIFMMLFVANLYVANNGGGCLSLFAAALCALTAVIWLARALG